jgi:thioredoxin 1
MVTKTTVKPLTLIAFENDWCAQCYTERPVVKNIQQKFAADLDVHLVNADQNPTLTEKYGIYSAPSLVLLKNGEVVEKVSRFVDEQQLTTIISYYR